VMNTEPSLPVNKQFHPLGAFLGCCIPTFVFMVIMQRLFGGPQEYWSWVLSGVFGALITFVMSGLFWYKGTARLGGWIFLGDLSALGAWAFMSIHAWQLLEAAGVPRSRFF
jgi:hypothetical protein